MIGGLESGTSLQLVAFLRCYKNATIKNVVVSASGCCRGSFILVSKPTKQTSRTTQHAQEDKECCGALRTALEWVVCKNKMLPSEGVAGQSTNVFLLN